MTAIIWAASKGQEAVVKLLLDRGADLTAKDNVSSTLCSCHGRIPYVR